MRQKDIFKYKRKKQARYMLMEEYLRNEIQRGIQEEVEKGCGRMLELTLKMLEDGLTDEIPRLKNEKKFREEMFRKYGL